MRIHAVMAGFNGNDDVQFVELRMSSAGQSVVGGHKLRFLDAGGAQTAEFTFPSNVSNGATGDSILVATAEYNDDHSPGHDADFEFSLTNTTGTSTDNRLHPVQSPGGKVIFEPAGPRCSGAGTPVDSVAYDPAATVSPDFGTRAVALPSPSTNQGLRLSNLAINPTNNNTEYSLQTASTITEPIPQASLAGDFRFPRNNARILSAMLEPAGVGGVVLEPDVTSQASTANPIDSGEDSGITVPAIVVTAAIVMAVAALSALEFRRRKRA
jgi:hypothetical protein